MWIGGTIADSLHGGCRPVPRFCGTRLCATYSTTMEAKGDKGTYIPQRLGKMKKGINWYLPTNTFFGIST